MFIVDEGDGINVDLDIGYPIKRDEFYNSFFNSNEFSDKLIEKLIQE